MTYEIDGVFYTDNTKEINNNTIFVKTFQNQKFAQNLNDVKSIEVNELYKNIIRKKDIKIVGITGTNGKTTTAAAIYSFLLDLGYGVALQGTRGFFINDKRVQGKSLTTPAILQTLYRLNLAINNGCDFFIMEVSSHSIVQKRIEFLEFALKIATNISWDHLDFHKSMEEYIRVKSSFFKDSGLKLINRDEDKLKFNYKNCYTYAVENPSTFSIEAYYLKNGISAVLKYFNEVGDFESSLVGLFNLYNLTAAISAVKLLTKKDLKEICAVVPEFGGVSGRMEVIRKDPMIVVDFAHTPDGMDKVLDSLKSQDIIVVFGAGGDRDVTKRAIMGKVAQRYAKKIILTNDNPRSENPKDIIDDILSGIDDKNKVEVIIDRCEAIKKAIKIADKKDTIMILGKGDEKYIEIGNKKIPFSDKECINNIMLT